MAQELNGVSRSSLLGLGPPSRGVTAGDVERAADSLLRSGERPTIDKIRQKLGKGSPNTINPLLDAWWKRLGNRLDSGPAAFHRLPESQEGRIGSLDMHRDVYYYVETNPHEDRYEDHTNDH